MTSMIIEAYWLPILIVGASIFLVGLLFGVMSNLFWGPGEPIYLPPPETTTQLEFWRQEAVVTKMELFDLRRAAIALYMAGHWTTDKLSSIHQDRLWKQLRDALYLPEGTETARAEAQKDATRDDNTPNAGPSNAS